MKIRLKLKAQCRLFNFQAHHIFRHIIFSGTSNFQAHHIFIWNVKFWILKACDDFPEIFKSECWGIWIFERKSPSTWNDLQQVIQCCTCTDLPKWNRGWIRLKVHQSWSHYETLSRDVQDFAFFVVQISPRQDW